MPYAPGNDEQHYPQLLWEKHMLNYAILVFAIGALGGLVLAAHVLRNKFAPLVTVAFALPDVGATGLILLPPDAYSGNAPQQVFIAFALLLAAALGGFFLASFHLRKKLPPKAIVAVHASVAVVGFLTLVSVFL
ncbi:hypothetical protein [Citrobacter enshiensis]|uniref:hypothetical protein n=1 Tax=Citrobacter enshiensis TaxID=2971264 RepID=UPI0023E875CA|nr:hypothetical protein [Citrobacter enshiensis]WET42347.1 hypothetical protein P2W74_09665 [Citrobacter enshiensis]